MCHRCLGIKHDWTDDTRLFVYAIALLVLTRSFSILFRNLYYMPFISKTKSKYTLSIEFLLAQLRGNNHWEEQNDQIILQMIYVIFHR